MVKFVPRNSHLLALSLFAIRATSQQNFHEVELDTAFIDAGMDSLSGVSLVSMLNRDFETALTPSVAPWGP